MAVTATIIVWGHALTALLFAVIALSQVRRTAALPRLAFVTALGLTALWGLAVAGIDSRDVVVRLAEGLRDLGWIAFMYALVRRDRAAPEASAVATIYGVVAVVIVGATVLAMLGAAIDPARAAPIVDAQLALQLVVAVSALVLVHHLYAAVTPQARDGIRLVVIALAAMWLVDLAVFVSAYLGSIVPPALLAARGIAMVLLAPLFALAVHRNGNWTLQLSRAVAYQSLSFAALALYAVAMLLATGLIGAVGGADARLAQTAFIFGSTAALMTILSTPWLRAWAKVKLAKHLFRHRYDYRAEWLRFTETLGEPGADAAPLEERIIKAVADVTDSPAGALLVPDGDGLGFAAAWSWDRDGFPESGADQQLARYLAETARIVELDAARASDAESAELAAVPLWMLDRADAWVLVPLVHFGKPAGAILLARPPVDRRLDWEDFDLLRIAGRQVASYLAEARAQGALADSRRFDEFNRRFAFIIHDIKNLVSQLSLVARNAERHADNPAFRADMIATLSDSAIRMNGLLARLSQHNSGRAEALVAVEVMPLVERVAAARRAQHPIACMGDRAALAEADPTRLEQVLGHLIQNAIEASPATEPVTLAVGVDRGRVTIEVIDRGCGMTPAFVRDQLFRPFVSSKPGGFGIGAYEARQLTAAMGGELDVVSREGEGSRFRIVLPAAATVTGRAA